MERTCKTCGAVKPLAEFREHIKGGKSYWEYECRLCGIERSKAWARENTERIRIRERARYKNDPEYRERKLARDRKGTAKKHDGPVEQVTFNGFRYRRYPTAKRPVHRRYFSRAGHLLHRDVWEFHNGPIPKGYQVHHIDEDTGNNDITNLECLTFAEHRAKHADEYVKRGRSPEQLAHLASVNAKAAEWHRSEAGKAWHAQHNENLRGRKSK